MKKSILLSTLLLTAVVLFAQVRPTNLGFAKTFPSLNLSDRGVGDTLVINNLGVEDTTWGSYTYPAPAWGSTTGHNSYGDMGWAEKYEVNSVDSTFDIIGVMGYFVGTVSASSTTKFASFGVYDADGTSGAVSPSTTTYSGVPGTQLTVATKAYTSLTVSGQALDFTPISVPVHVDKDFFVSFELEAYTPQGITDSIKLLVAINSRPGPDTLKNGQPFSRNAVKWSDNKWYDEHYQNARLMVNYILFPVVIVAAADTNSVGIASGITRANLTYHGNYPNPATTVSNMKFSLNDNTPVTINVYDMEGRLMFSKNQGEMLAGTHTVALDVNSLAAGSYLVSIATDKATIGGMFQVVR